MSRHSLLCCSKQTPHRIQPMRDLQGTSKAQHCFWVWTLLACLQQVMPHRMQDGKAWGLMKITTAATCVLRNCHRDLERTMMGLFKVFPKICQQKQELCRL